MMKMMAKVTLLHLGFLLILKSVIVSSQSKNLLFDIVTLCIYGSYCVFILYAYIFIT